MRPYLHRMRSQRMWQNHRQRYKSRQPVIPQETPGLWPAEDLCEQGPDCAAMHHDKMPWHILLMRASGMLPDEDLLKHQGTQVPGYSLTAVATLHAATQYTPYSSRIQTTRCVPSVCLTMTTAHTRPLAPMVHAGTSQSSRRSSPNSKTMLCNSTKRTLIPARTRAATSTSRAKPCVISWSTRSTTTLTPLIPMIPTLYPFHQLTQRLWVTNFGTALAWSSAGTSYR
jgi:hypothetical protein